MCHSQFKFRLNAENTKNIIDIMFNRANWNEEIKAEEKKRWGNLLEAFFSSAYKVLIKNKSEIKLEFIKEFQICVVNSKQKRGRNPFHVCKRWGDAFTEPNEN